MVIIKKLIRMAFQTKLKIINKTKVFECDKRRNLKFGIRNKIYWRRILS